MYKRERSFGHNSATAPVQVGQELDVKIDSVGEKGDGIAKVKGFVIFVPNVKVGDEVRIKVNKVLKKVGFGEVIGAATGEGSSGSDEDSNEEESEEESSESSSQGDTNEDDIDDESEDEDDDMQEDM